MDDSGSPGHVFKDRNTIPRDRDMSLNISILTKKFQIYNSLSYSSLVPMEIPYEDDQGSKNIADESSRASGGSFYECYETDSTKTFSIYVQIIP